MTTTDGTTIRVLLAKSFIDSHDRAIKTIASLLRDEGMEVVLLDYQTPDDLAAVAVQEDVDVVGVSFMSGGQVHVTRELIKALDRLGRVDLPVVVGGTIRPFDRPGIEAAGAQAVFTGGEELSSIAAAFRQLATTPGSTSSASR